jgi:membrane-bound lytic murein transglycosylase D
LPRAQILTASAFSGSLATPLTALRAEPLARPRPDQAASTVYVVKSGETLAAIARARGVDPNELAELNAMQPREPLLPGQSLRVPGAGPADATLVTHRVRKGDSLDTIARRYGVTVDELMRWNPVAGIDLHNGEVIRIYRRSA